MAGHGQQRIGHAGTSSSCPWLSAVDSCGGGSASTFLAEGASATRLLPVDWQTKDRLRWRSTFILGGHAWSVTYSPDGFCPSTHGWMCFWLSLEQPGGAGAGGGARLDGDVLVRTKYCLLDLAGEPVPSSRGKTGTGSVCSLASMRRQSLSTLFMRREELEPSSCVKDGVFSVRCDLALVKRTCRLSAPPPDLHRQLGDLLATGVGADVTLEVGDGNGESFPAHRSVLAARSPVFRAALFGGGAPDGEGVATSTTTGRVVRISDVEPRVFRALLHYIYTDTLPEVDDTGDKQTLVQHLLLAAERYHLEGLKSICEDVLCMRTLQI